ncbi:MAG: aminoacyl-tRNA hydrolase [Actinomycetia bacterium]|nr:aminoacyl-tRNA hydrolase [Actinomycetes bacterium]
MILIVGLGNPGKDYRGTRHNIGFVVVDELIPGTDSGNKYTKFNSVAVNAKYSDTDLLFLKPRTFMNNSGSAVAAALKFYGDEISSILVIHDDIDLAFGRIKIKRGGSTAGHRGLQSIFAKTNSLDFDRLRFGVDRPPGRMDASNYVLRKFGKSETKELDFLIKDAVDIIKDYIENGLDHAANKYN